MYSDSERPKAEITIRSVANGYLIESEPRVMGMAIDLGKIYVATSVIEVTQILICLLRGE